MEDDPLLSGQNGLAERSYSSELRLAAERDFNTRLIFSLFIDSLPGTRLFLACRKEESQLTVIGLLKSSSRIFFRTLYRP